MKCTAGTLSAVLWLAATALAYGQANAALHTADTILDFEVGTSAPRVVSIRIGKHEAWSNRGSEVLIDHVTINGEKVPLQWRYNSAASHADANGIAWIYDSSDPKLQLTWEWDVRAGTGPIEHSIRIENLGSKEVWLPLQDSFQFNFQIDPKISLEHFFVEKGAGSPSAIGTHQVTVPAGYKWIGTSSTYAHPKENEPREVIPYFSVQRADQSRLVCRHRIQRAHSVSVERKDQITAWIGWIESRSGPIPYTFRTRRTIRHADRLRRRLRRRPGWRGQRAAALGAASARQSTSLEESQLSSDGQQQLGQRHAGR